MSWYKIKVKEKYQKDGVPPIFYLSAETKKVLNDLVKKQGYGTKEIDIEKQKKNPFDTKKPVIEKKNLDGVSGLSSQVFDEKPDFTEEKKTIAQMQKLRDDANTILEKTDNKKTEGEENAKRKTK
tara:strand:- start:3170 stop:3544 length:375 start_codon:yes stop_codon:yes gene_type:complete